MYITGRGPFCRKKLLFPSRNKISKETIFQICGTTAFLKHQQHRPQLEISIFQPLMFKMLLFMEGIKLLGIFNLLDADHQPTNPIPVQTSKSCPKGVTLESDQQGFDLKSPGEGIWFGAFRLGALEEQQSQKLTMFFSRIWFKNWWVFACFKAGDFFITYPRSYNKWDIVNWVWRSKKDFMIYYIRKCIDLLQSVCWNESKSRKENFAAAQEVGEFPPMHNSSQDGITFFWENYLR